MTQKVSGEKRTWHTRIRPCTYRGKEGFSINGWNARQQPRRIFVRTRATAEAVRDAVQRGEDVDPIMLAEKP